MPERLVIARSEFILGGQKSGKSRRAESLAAAWLAQGAAHRAVLIATARPMDAEMRARIARHQRERAERVPGLAMIEAPHDVAAAIAGAGGAETLRIVDCLTLWLTQQLMPLMRMEGSESNEAPARSQSAQTAMFLEAIERCPGPLVLVGNEIGLGVIPLGREVRAFVDALGQLNQQVAAACERVTLMVAGLPLTVKGVA